MHRFLVSYLYTRIIAVSVVSPQWNMPIEKIYRNMIDKSLYSLVIKVAGSISMQLR